MGASNPFLDIGTRFWLQLNLLNANRALVSRAYHCHEWRSLILEQPHSPLHSLSASISDQESSLNVWSALKMADPGPPTGLFLVYEPNNQEPAVE